MLKSWIPKTKMTNDLMTAMTSNFGYKFEKIQNVLFLCLFWIFIWKVREKFVPLHCQ